jgi:hypothetical protein
MVSFGCNPAVVGPQSQCGGDEPATQMKLKLKARVNRSDAPTIRHALEQLSAQGSVRKEGDEFVVEAEAEGVSAKELNRTFLSALRKVEKRTTLRAEWTSGDTTERFFDYVLKKTVARMSNCWATNRERVADYWRDVVAAVPQFHAATALDRISGTKAGNRSVVIKVIWSSRCYAQCMGSSLTFP